MSKKQIPSWIVKVFGVSLIIVGLVTVEETLRAAKPAPTDITISKIQATKPPVKFPHKAHVDAMKGNCVQCHHTRKGEEDPQSCFDCHKAAAEGKKLSAKDALHKTCVDCHKKAKTEKPDSKAPTVCTGCHK